MLNAVASGSGTMSGGLMDEADANHSASPYAEGSRVLVPQGTSTYEAKIERVAFDSKMGWKCFVHYTGWNKKYDEWVACSAVRAFDETTKVVKPPANGTDNRDGEDKAKIEIKLPDRLQARMVSEWDSITRENNLISLPKEERTVAQILDSFLDSGGFDGARYGDTVDGLKDYFDRNVRSLLLYPQEQAQAREVLSDGSLPRNVYGAEHLVRLLIKLPEILPFSDLTEDALRETSAFLNALVKVL